MDHLLPLPRPSIHRDSPLAPYPPVQLLLLLLFNLPLLWLCFSCLDFFLQYPLITPLILLYTFFSYFPLHRLYYTFGFLAISLRHFYSVLYHSFHASQTLYIIPPFLEPYHCLHIIFLLYHSHSLSSYLHNSTHPPWGFVFDETRYCDTRMSHGTQDFWIYYIHHPPHLLPCCLAEL